MEAVIEGVVEVEHIVAEQILHKKTQDEESNIQMPTGFKRVLCHLAFFLLGVCHILPITFFSAANNFWMYKFRNTSLDTDWNEAANRVALQQNYPSANLIASSVSCLGFGIFNVFYGGRLSIVGRLLVSLLVTFATFLIFTASVKINSDDWQVLFFALVLLCYMLLNGAITVNIVGTMNLFSRFPKEYMRTCLLGEGAAGIVGDVLNILTVWMFNGDIINSTLIYFSAGSFVVGFTLLLTFWVQKMTFFQECVASKSIREKGKVPSRPEFFRILNKLKFTICLMGTFILGMSTTFPGITSLVVSEQDGTDSLWANSYFSPVMTFLLGDCGMLLGRLLSNMTWNLPENAVMAFAILRTLILVPMLWLCKAQPRSHLPVIFDQDWEYGLILLIFMTTSGYLINESIIFVMKKVDGKDADVAFTMFGLAVNVLQSVTSPVGIFIVNVL